MSFTATILVLGLGALYLLYRILVVLQDQRRGFDPAFPVFTRINISQEELQVQRLYQEYRALDEERNRFDAEINKITGPSSRTGEISEKEIDLRAKREELYERLVSNTYEAERHRKLKNYMIESNYAVSAAQKTIAEISSVSEWLVKYQESRDKHRERARQARVEQGHFQRCPGCRKEIPLGRLACDSCYEAQMVKRYPDLSNVQQPRANKTLQPPNRAER